MLLEIRLLYLKVYLGFFKWEQKRKRVVILNLKSKILTENSLKNISLKQTVDYDLLVAQIKDFISQKRFDLLENFTNQLAKFLIQKNNIEWLEVECRKPSAVAEAKYTAVTYRCHGNTNYNNFGACFD